MLFSKKLTTIATAAVIVLSGPAAVGGESQPPTPATLDQAIEEKMNESGMVGLGAAILVNKKVVWTKGYGFADKALAVRFTPDTVMNIGSISKTFTGVALMRAVQAKKLDLDEDINRYLPFKVTNPYFPDERITLRHLATHTSSITDQWPVYEASYHYGGDSPEALDAFLKDYLTPSGKRYAKENFGNARPGAMRDYSNIGAGLAGYIVELAVGEKLNTYAKRHIFTPLKMTNSGWLLSEIPAGKHARLYLSQGGMTIPIQLYGVATYPDGGVRTSVADLSRFFAALLNDGEYEGKRILEKETVAEMTRLAWSESKKPENVDPKEKNSGIFWQTKFSGTRMGHGGTDPGVKTEMLSDLTRDVAVVLMTNTSLCDHDMKMFSAVFEELWKYAVKLHMAQTSKN